MSNAKTKVWLRTQIHTHTHTQISLQKQSRKYGGTDNPNWPVPDIIKQLAPVCINEKQQLLLCQHNSIVQSHS